MLYYFEYKFPYSHMHSSIKVRKDMCAYMKSVHVCVSVCVRARKKQGQQGAQTAKNSDLA